MYFDTHAHLNDYRYAAELDKIVEETNIKMVDRIVNVGYDIPSSNRAIAIANKYNGLYAAIGIHPNDVSNTKEDDLIELNRLCKHPKVVAIGETGLDYHYEGFDKERQSYFFNQQMEIAKQNNLPVIIHSRDAQKETYNILSKHGKYQGIVHCYSGSYEMAEMLIALGYYIGIGGTVTFKNARKVKEIVEKVSIDKIVIETDCPYLTPTPYRGTINYPHYVHYVAKEIANIKKMSIEQVATITTSNGCKIYNIK